MALRLLPIARPCREAFDAMVGDDRTRFCSSCGKHVHDLSAGTEDDARALLATSRGERICVRYARDAQGSIRFRAVATAAAAVALSVAACTTPPVPPNQPAAPHVTEETVDHEMGDMIPDAEDRCPDDPEPNDDGCPEPSPAAAPRP
jgi:hypothetical protein